MAGSTALCCVALLALCAGAAALNVDMSTYVARVRVSVWLDSTPSGDDCFHSTNVGIADFEEGAFYYKGLVIWVWMCNTTGQARVREGEGDTVVLTTDVQKPTKQEAEACLSDSRVFVTCTAATATQFKALTSVAALNALGGNSCIVKIRERTQLIVIEGAAPGALPGPGAGPGALPGPGAGPGELIGPHPDGEDCLTS